jgi:hypothetical protein
MSGTNQAFEVKEKLAALEQALLKQLPTMPTLLRDIHRSLKADPDTVTLLSEEECAVLVQGLKKQTGTTIATSALKSPKKKALSKMTVDDL